MSKGEPIKVKYQTLVVLWLALLSSQALFFGIVWFARPGILTTEARGSILHNSPLVTVVFAAIAILFFVLSFVLKRQYMRRAVQDRDASCVQTGLLLGCMLSEVSSILGLVLAFVFNHPYFYFWLALAALGIVLHFPRKGNLDAASSK